MYWNLRYNGRMTITIDLPADAIERLTRQAAQQGQDVAGYVRHLAVRESEAEETPSRQPALRMPGLHRGRYGIADDFDTPLPDSFWLGEAGAA
jgi:hypothetical protein